MQREVDAQKRARHHSDLNRASGEAPARNPWAGTRYIDHEEGRHGQLFRRNSCRREGVIRLAAKSPERKYHLNVGGHRGALR